MNTARIRDDRHDGARASIMVNKIWAPDTNAVSEINSVRMEVACF